jgi:hypothetical protein
MEPCPGKSVGKDTLLILRKVVSVPALLHGTLALKWRDKERHDLKVGLDNTGEYITK